MVYKLTLTEKVKEFLGKYLTIDTPFDQDLYAKVFLKAYELYENESLSVQELASIGSFLQSRKLPDRSIGSFTKYNLFDIFELSSNITYYINSGKSEKDLKKYLDHLIELSEQLRSLRSKLLHNQ